MKKTVLLSLSAVLFLSAGATYARKPVVNADSNVQMHTQRGGVMNAKSEAECSGRGTRCQTFAGAAANQSMGNANGLANLRSNVQMTEQTGGVANFKASNKSSNGADSQSAAGYVGSQVMVGN